MNKKVIYVLILILMIIGIILFFNFLNNNSESSKNTDTSPKTLTLKETDNPKNEEVNSSNKETQSTSIENDSILSSNSSPDTVATTTVSQLEDGTLYSLEENVTSDVVIGDDYFDLQLSNIMLNPSDYDGKNIEIEGMYLLGQLDPITMKPYTFVGRYSTSNLCAFCPTGYSYMEYLWNGEPIKLSDSLSWIKVVGTLAKGNDGYQDYYYIDAKSIEIMNERGIDTVNN